MGADITKAVRKCPRVTYSDSFSFKFILEQLFLRHDLAVSVTEEGVEYDSQPVMDPCAVELQFIMRIRVPAVQPLMVCYDFSGKPFPVNGEETVYDQGNLVLCKIRRGHDRRVEDFIGAALFQAESQQQEQPQKHEKFLYFFCIFHMFEFLLSIMVRISVAVPKRNSVIYYSVI